MSTAAYSTIEAPAPVGTATSAPADKATSVSNAKFIVDILQRLAVEKEQKKSDDEAHSWATAQQLNYATWTLGILQVTLIILFATVGGSEVLGEDAAGSGTTGYNMFIGVEIMMFIGFGYLMTFMKWYGLSAVAFTMVITAIGLQWAVFTESFFHQLMNNVHHWHNVDFTIYSLLDSLYAVSAVLITFGALIGKVSPFQLILLTIIELACHSCNYEILMMGVMKLTDVGGTYSDHMFGAYFGLSVAYMLGKPKSSPAMGTVPDIFSLIGTLFLWVYWPSFVAGAAEQDSPAQQRAIVNTILALSASTVGTFWLGSILAHDKKYRPVDIQNATLAGGVAIGCTADLNISPFGAIMIGLAAGLASCFGFNKISPMLEEKLGLHDTCGIHNLHAMPSVIGGLASVIIAGYKSSNGKSHDSEIYGLTYESQWWRQWVAILLCMGFAIATGLITGWILLQVKPKEEIKEYHDDQWWEVADDYGKTLYSELAAVVKNVEKTSHVNIPTSIDIDKAVSDWSSHGGRRKVGHGSTNSSSHGVEQGKNAV